MTTFSHNTAPTQYVERAGSGSPTGGSIDALGLSEIDLLGHSMGDEWRRS